MAAAKLKNNIVSAFKMHGLTLRSEASRYLVEVLAPVSSGDRNLWLDRIIEIIQKHSLSTSMVGRDECETAVQECNAEREDDSDSIFNVIDAFSVPRFSYVKERKKFVPDSTLEKPDPALYGTTADKASMFRDRYTIVHQRTLRHELFTPPALGSTDTESNKFQLQPMEYLVGSTAKLGNVLVLGMLIQLREGKWFLEDPTGSVQLDFTEANFQPGLFTENSFVLAEGWYEDGIFYVEAFGLPPPEKAETTRAYFGNINFFGGPSSVQVKASTRLAEIEAENTDAMFVLLSDVWLDNSRVMERLSVLFKGYSDFPPTAFIICGNFLSSSQVSHHAQKLKDCLRDLGAILSNYPKIIKSSQLIFVPGPNDLGHATVLPRPAIPTSVTSAFRKKVPNAVFTSNPCRIQYCTQEIVIFREDIVTKMCRHCVKFPADGNVPTHFAKSLISQAHLCSLPLHVCPVYWAFDCGLRLYPLPDVIVTADKFDPFTTTAVSTTVINPICLHLSLEDVVPLTSFLCLVCKHCLVFGHLMTNRRALFLRSDFGFKVYYPATKEVQDSQVVDDADRTLNSSVRGDTTVSQSAPANSASSKSSTTQSMDNV